MNERILSPCRTRLIGHLSGIFSHSLRKCATKRPRQRTGSQAFQFGSSWVTGGATVVSTVFDRNTWRAWCYADAADTAAAPPCHFPAHPLEPGRLSSLTLLGFHASDPDPFPLAATPLLLWTGADIAHAIEKKICEFVQDKYRHVLSLGWETGTSPWSKGTSCFTPWLQSAEAIPLTLPK
jgi:hypothetical protein